MISYYQDHGNDECFISLEEGLLPLSTLSDTDKKELAKRYHICGSIFDYPVKGFISIEMIRRHLGEYSD